MSEKNPKFIIMLKQANKRVIPLTNEEKVLLKEAMEKSKGLDLFAKQREEARKYLHRMKTAKK